MTLQINIDGKAISAAEGDSIRQAALSQGIYIPGLCSHPDLSPAREIHWAPEVYRGDSVVVGDYQREVAGEEGSCNLCLIAVEGRDELVRACEILVAEGLVVRTQGEDIQRARQQALAKILAHHPHACLTCAQRQGCSLTSCSSNVPVDERCCILLNRCEIGKVADFIGIPDNTPKYALENLPKFSEDPFFVRNYNLCIGCTRCVRACGELGGVEALAATFRDDRVWVGTVQPGGLAESYCRFCGTCVEVCPTGALLDKPDSKPVHHGELAPCVAECPAGIDIPAYVRHIAIGDFEGALRVIYDRVPFPGILGYVCFHPCEAACKRDILDDSIAICSLKRFVYEAAGDRTIQPLKKAAPTGKKIAIIGSGPAGLTAAFYLAQAGHTVEVFEAASKPGGMLRHAIPEYRLPESILENELRALYDLGIVFKTGMRLGETFHLNDSSGDEYSAVLLTVGTSGSRRLNVPGEDLSGVVQALDFLRSVRQNKAIALDGQVVVIGGGNVAIDAAMSVQRLGAQSVSLVCLEQRGEMPAHTWEIAQATEEGIAIHNGWGPKEFQGLNGKLSKVRFKRCIRVFDERGSFSPQYDESETFDLPGDHVIIAIGQKVMGDGLSEIAGLKLSSSGLIEADKATFKTGAERLFAAGDAVNGPSSVIDALASGRKAADAIDEHLGGPGIETPPAPDKASSDPHLGQDANFHTRKAIKPEQLRAPERVKSFAVIEQVLSADGAQQEALRCLRCNLRALITPVILPPDKWQPLTREALAAIPHVEGVFELAGADRKAIKISGVVDVRAALENECQASDNGLLFCWEEDRMYSKRESELIQQHLQQYGQMPGGGAGELDDLF